MDRSDLERLMHECRNLTREIEALAEVIGPEAQRIHSKSVELEGNLGRILGIVGSGAGRCPCCQRPY